VTQPAILIARGHRTGHQDEPAYQHDQPGQEDEALSGVVPAWRATALIAGPAATRRDAQLKAVWRTARLVRSRVREPQASRRMVVRSTVRPIRSRRGPHGVPPPPCPRARGSHGCAKRL
jgi:hypothetical protein